MPDKILAGLDPGIAYFGAAAFRATMDKTGPTLEILAGAVIQTNREAKKRGVSVAGDDFQRARMVSRALRLFLVEHDVGMIVAEERSFPRGANAIKSMSAAWGVIASLSDSLSIPIIVVPPKRIKLELAGSETASKAEVERAVIQAHPKAAWIGQMDLGVPPGQANHFFDAAGAAMAGCRSDEFLAWLR